MTTILAGTWWALALRGVVAILFGLFTFAVPQVTVAALALLFAAYAFVDGVFNLILAVRGGAGRERWWVLLFEGIIGIAVAAFTVAWPVITVLVLLYIVAAWAVITGILELAAAIRLRKQIEGEWLLALAGIASLIFGVLLFLSPGIGAIVIAWWIGAYVFVFGILMLALAFRVRAWGRTSFEPDRHLT